jgi:hypothetical protein
MRGRSGIFPYMVTRRIQGVTRGDPVRASGLPTRESGGGGGR